MKRKIFIRAIISMMVAWIIYLIIILPRPLFDKALSTAVYDRDGNLLGARTAMDGQWRFEERDTLPDKFVQCLVAFEDNRFYYHPGFDPLALGGAIWDNIFSKRKRGGSTLTMQTMRLALKNQKRSFLSKLEEISLAVYLEVRYSKRKILNLYASNAPFGGNVVGVEAACWRYYQKPPELLTWAEAATLAVLPNAPALIHPGRNREVLKNKRNALLKKMWQQGALEEEVYEMSLLEEIPMKPLPLPSITPHLVDYLKLKDKSGGSYKTTIDPAIQQMVNEVGSYYREMNEQNSIHNLAILVLDNDNGSVMAYYGNHKEAKHGMVDMIQAKRSSGSILKPLLYCALLDDGKLTSRSLVKDIPVSINGYAPQNFDKNYRGALFAHEALQRSLNIPFVLMLKSYGLEKALDVFRKVGLTTLNKPASHYGLTLILGGAEVSLWDLCGVYSSMSRSLTHFVEEQSRYDDSDYRAPSLVPMVSKKEWEHHTSHFRAGSIYETFEALKNLERPSEEGLWQEFNSTKNIAWKTGTSFGHKDAWAVGVDKKYTIGIWVGNADGSPRTNLTGIYAAAPVLFDVFNRLPEHQWFDIPYDDLQKTAVCKESGHAIGPHCLEADTLYLALSSVGYEKCPYHKNLFLNETKQFQVFKNCFNSGPIVEESCFELPAEVIAYYRNYHPNYKEVPDFHPDCMDLAAEKKKGDFAIIYPTAFTRIMLPKDITGVQQTAIFQANHNNKKASLHWHIDEKYIGTTIEFHSLKITTQPGKHKLTVVDDFGNRQTRFYEVI